VAAAKAAWGDQEGESGEVELEEEKRRRRRWRRDIGVVEDCRRRNWGVESRWVRVRCACARTGRVRRAGLESGEREEKKRWWRRMRLSVAGAGDGEREGEEVESREV
jgi:hypothetical protein